MLIEPSEQLCFETQLLLRLSLGFFFGERLLHIKNSLRKEAVVAQTNELGKLPAVQILAAAVLSALGAHAAVAADFSG